MALRQYILILYLVFLRSVKGDLCPKQCDCDMDNGLNRAMCTDQNIISIEVGVPRAVQVYSLSHNRISELENKGFKRAGYLSLQELYLSDNEITDIGIHAFEGLEQLVHLDLSGNRLRRIAPDVFFWDTPQLTSLDLSSNIFEVLDNEPFLMHGELQILNLQNCRMKSFPERMFKRLPNLRKLDISENYMITLDVQVLLPLKRLVRIEIRNDFWKCNNELMALETWITSRGITCQKRCKKDTNKMSQKMISMVPVEKEDIDVNQVWNITTAKNDSIYPTETRILTPFEKFDKEFSPVQSFILGIEIGLAIGVIGTYVWLRKFCHCGQLNCTRPQTRRQRRRAQRVRDGDMRTNLLWSNVISPDMETPPSFRRQLRSEDNLQFPTYGVPLVSEAGLHVDAIRLPDRAETPPPPYHECRINI